MRRAVLLVAMIALVVPPSATARAEEPRLMELAGDLGVHDPAMIKAGDTYYLFATASRRNRGIVSRFTSPDMRQWSRAGTVMPELPAWVADEVPKARNAWAPDISFFNGKYHLYYSLSSFGVNNSAIALATNKSLDPNSPDYKWVDEGMVIRSRPDEDDFNAIDPNVAIADDARVWLSWGSFWDGIMMRELDSSTGKPSPTNTTLYKLAARPRGQHVTPPVEGAIEAPFIVKHGDDWYLFVSWDFCCRGAKSDYKVVVGRSKEVTGPYRDRDGKLMTDGGGTLILEAATDNWRGRHGHPALYHEDGVDYLVFHAYSAKTGRSQLQISTIDWQDGWPRVARLP